MNKKLLAVLALVAVIGTGAFAQLAIGASGAIYSDSFNSAQSIADRFQSGQGIFWGPFIELGLHKLALGFSANFSSYTEDFGVGYNDIKMLDMDYALYVQGHPLGYKYWIDPFVEAGGGYMAKNYANASDNPDESNTPLLKTAYFELGGGLGFNLGALGIFAKFDYLFPSGTSSQATLKSGATFDLEAYPINKMKFLLGAKIIL
jgi:hypothetical protein